MAHEDIEYERSGTSYSFALFFGQFFSAILIHEAGDFPPSHPIWIAELESGAPGSLVCF